MKIENNKIIECTESELYSYWLVRYDDIMSFPEYMERCKALGTVIIND